MVQYTFDMEINWTKLKVCFHQAYVSHGWVFGSWMPLNQKVLGPGGSGSLLALYYTILINLSPTCDCDAPDEIFISSPCLEGCDKAQILSDGTHSTTLLAVFWVKSMAAVHCWSQIDHFQLIKSEFQQNLPYSELMWQTTPLSGSFVTCDSDQILFHYCAQSGNGSTTAAGQMLIAQSSLGRAKL
jgi:hypothetical protein